MTKGWLMKCQWTLYVKFQLIQVCWVCLYKTGILTWCPQIWRNRGSSRPEFSSRQKKWHFLNNNLLTVDWQHEAIKTWYYITCKHSSNSIEPNWIMGEAKYDENYISVTLQNKWEKNEDRMEYKKQSTSQAKYIQTWHEKVQNKSFDVLYFKSPNFHFHPEKDLIPW